MWEAIALSFGLAMDATAVSAARGLAAEPRERVILPLLFGGFQSGMAALGWMAGTWAGPYIARWDHWVAFGLLAVIGGKMVIDGWRSRTNDNNGGDRHGAGGDAADAAATKATSGPPTGSLALYLGLAVATSIDAAAAGLTLPLLAVAPWLALVLIGAITAACSFAGHLAGGLVGKRFGARLAMLGGLVLIGIGVQMVIRAL
jgi:putative Mn2+ efflux pump MntP